MTDDLIFRPNSSFKSIEYDAETDSWGFHFSNEISFYPSEFWRVTEKHFTIMVSFDHGHKFGHPKPLNLVESLSELIVNKILLEIKVDKYSGDLTLRFTDDIEIQIYPTSSGYETYEFTILKEKYIALGSGKLGIVETTDSPQYFNTRIL